MEQLIALMNTMLSGFIAILPNILAALIVLLFGLVLGRVLGRISEEIAVRSKIDKWISQKNHITFNVSSVANVIVRWVVYLVFIEQAAIFLGIAAVQSFISSIIGFIPGLIGAGIIIIVGYAIAIYMKERIITGKTMYSSIVGKIVFFLLLYFSIALALPFTGVNPTLVNWALLIIIASFGLGMAIAMGLGFKEFFAEMGKTLSKRVLKSKK